MYVTQDYEFSLRYGLEIVEASEIANSIPWHGQFISARKVEELLKHILLQLPLTKEELAEFSDKK